MTGAVLCKFWVTLSPKFDHVYISYRMYGWMYFLQTINKGNVCNACVRKCVFIVDFRGEVFIFVRSFILYVMLVGCGVAEVPSSLFVCDNYAVFLFSVNVDKSNFDYNLVGN